MLLNRRSLLTTALSPLLVAAGRSQSAATVPQGLWPVMLTPFKEDKSIDWEALDALTDWYIQNGADGLFACCQSSEVWELTETERLQIAARVVKRAGKTPVVAGGLPGFAAAPVASFVEKLAGHGVKAAVLTTCQVSEKSDPDSLWKDRVESILAASNHLPFGLYEAPRPYKRLLSPEMMHWAGRTNRFVFHKDTSCEIGAIAAKVQAVKGTPFRIFNAHVPILIDAIRKGGHGFSGVAANAWPNVVAYAVHHEKDRPERAAQAQEFLTKAEKVLSVRYPLSAKILANLAGIPVKPVCRRNIVPLTDQQMSALRDVRKSADSLLG
ncbi:MAG TPA: dihydrodipicolinate synthase family protein [Bryobacteraceae bacterium]|nr:dihydrodipicolinate synthase family protein [Bryobacteraceae bacterium]